MYAVGAMPVKLAFVDAATMRARIWVRRQAPTSQAPAHAPETPEGAKAARASR